MKFRNDFITNSSSTSFLVILKEDFTEEDFLEAFGVKADSPFSWIFKRFYTYLIMDSDRIEFIHEYKICRGEELHTDNVLMDKAIEAHEKGYIVKHGKLHSEEEISQIYLCTEPFELCTDAFEIHAMDSFW